MTDIIFSYNVFVDPGANGGGINLGGTTITTPVFLSAPNQASSAGNFAGPNGTINWQSVATIAAGSQIYTNTLTFTSAQPFGTVMVINYFDEDVPPNLSDNLLVVVGTPGGADFQLLTVSGSQNFGISQAAGFTTLNGASYIGWAGMPYASLRNLIAGAGAAYSIPGVITLAATTDPRYPGLPVYGPADMTTGLAFDLNPGATTATMVLSLGGSPAGQPVGPSVPVPTMTEWGMIIFCLLLAGSALWALRRKHARLVH